jgi:hypothetical protein
MQTEKANMYTQAQKETANDILRGYANQGADFSCEDYQQKGQWIFKARLDHGTYFVIVGKRGAVINNGWMH